MSIEKRLLNKKDFMQKIIEPHNLEELKNLKINELRELMDTVLFYMEEEE